MQRAVETFHLATSAGWRTIAGGTELADDDLAVTTAPQYFVPVAPVDKPSARAPRSTRRKSA